MSCRKCARLVLTSKFYWNKVYWKFKSATTNALAYFWLQVNSEKNKVYWKIKHAAAKVLAYY
jgi:hypothetical protein